MARTVLTEESSASYSAYSSIWEGIEHCLELLGGPSGASCCGLGPFLWRSAAVVFECEWVWMCACGRLLIQECEDSPGVVGLPLMGDKGPRCGLHCDSWAI